MRSFNLLCVLLLAGVLVAGCDFFEQRDRTFGDDPKLEFFPLSETVDEGDAEDAGGTLTVETSIQLIGRQRDSDLTVNYTVVDTTLEAEGAEAAEEGTHFTLPATSATLPANSSTVPVEVNVLDNNQDDGDTNFLLFLRLQEDNEVEPAENLKTFTLTIRGADE